MTGLLIALFIVAILILPSLATGRIYSRWPLRDIDQETQPAKFRGIVGLWTGCAVMAAAWGIITLLR